MKKGSIMFQIKDGKAVARVKVLEVVGDSAKVVDYLRFRKVSKRMDMTPSMVDNMAFKVALVELEK